MPDGATRALDRGRRGALTFHQHVRERLLALIPPLGLDAARATVLELFDEIGREPLAFLYDRRPVRWSRINADGTPFQFGLALSDAGPVLQFLSEPARSDAPNEVRLRAARRRIHDLAHTLGAGTIEDVSAWLEVVAPLRAVDLLANEAGPIWLGAGFIAGAKPRLKIYVNAKWGRQRDRWSRLAALADGVCAGSAWRALKSSLHPALEPLGTAMTIAADAPLQGRIYLQGEGMSFADHEHQAAACGAITVAHRLPALRDTLLANGVDYAARSGVCSFGLQADAEPSFKLELCGHCAFTSDVEARTRCTDWLARAAVDPSPYLTMVDVLSGGAISEREIRLHGHVGLGEQRGMLCPTFYFNPAPAV